MPDIEPTPPSALRRDRKAPAVTGLVAAPPVRSSRVPSAVTAGVRGGWLIAGGIAVAIVVALSGTILATGFGDAEPAISTEERDLRAIYAMDDTCAQPGAGEAGGSVHRVGTCEHLEDADADTQNPLTQAPESELTPTPRASGQPQAPDARRPGPAVTQSPQGPNAPAPGSGNHAPDPGPGSPAPAPAPAPAPTPAPAPPVHVPKTLAFTDLTENRIGLLGIGLLSSYTLSVSGEPGSTAAISYGSRSAGSVTFDTNGRASITLGRSLIDLGLVNPVIRASYSDGTSGNEIQVRRDSI